MRQVGSAQMNRTIVALLAALEALIAVAVGIGIVLVPLTVLWAAQFGMAVDWAVFWRAAADVWLAGHGVDLAVTLPAVTVATLGLPAASAAFPLTIAVLGFALLTAAFGVRAGLRSTLPIEHHEYPGVVRAIEVLRAAGYDAKPITLWSCGHWFPEDADLTAHKREHPFAHQVDLP